MNQSMAVVRCACGAERGGFEDRPEEGPASGGGKPFMQTSASKKKRLFKVY